MSNPLFQSPQNWQWHFFEHKKRKLRFGYAIPENPEAIVICLPGLGEFCEKYFEIAHNCLDQNLGIFVLDWMGQGGSNRYLKNLHKQHSLGFTDNVDDLKFWIDNFIKDPNFNKYSDTPLALLSHSMGAHFALRYLSESKEHPIDCAAFSAPFIGIRRISFLPDWLLLCLSRLLSTTMNKNLVKKETVFSEDDVLERSIQVLTSDRHRASIQTYWYKVHPLYYIHGVTFGWVHEALKSCKLLKKNLKKISTPCVIGMAGHEKIVSNPLIKEAVKIMKASKLITYPEAKHEILMETGNIRNHFLDKFFKLIQTSIIEKNSK